MGELEVLKRKNKRYKIILGILVIILIAIIISFFIHDDCGGGSLLDDGEGAILAFNSKFDGYIGDNVSGSNTKTLISAIISNNNSNQDDIEKQVTVIKGNADGISEDNRKIQTSEELIEMRKEIRAGGKYKVTAKYGQNGMIIGVGIEELEASKNVTNNVYNNALNK